MSSTRRYFLKAGAGAAAGTAFLSTRPGFSQAPPAPGEFFFLGLPLSPPVAKFVDPLPIPSVHRPAGMRDMPGPGGNPVPGPHYEVSMTEFTQKMHRDLPATRLWGYAGVFPGPSFEVQRGKPISVRFTNNLPNQHLFAFAIDPTLFGALPGTPQVRSVVHLHGSRISPESDGHPEAWFTQNFAQKGSRFASEISEYPNDQPPTMLWYHDHVLGITRLNVMAGLAGLYFIRDPGEESLGLPRNEFEIPIVIQDKRFNSDGSIHYPSQGVTPNHPIWSVDYFGDVAVVNGKVYPFLEVEPKRYRFRMLNASNSRVFNVHLDNGPPFVQIGTDLGYLPKPVTVQALLLAGAERADVIVDFAAYEGKDIVMINDAKTPFSDSPLGTPPGGTHGPIEVMQFRVRRKNNAVDQSRIPTTLPYEGGIDASTAVLTRDIIMTERTTPFMAPTVLLLEDKFFEEPVGTLPKNGTVEIWRFINAVFFAHPQHIHLAEQNILDRQAFDPFGFMATGQIALMGNAAPPAPNEVGAAKDTVLVPEATVTRVAVKFQLPSSMKVVAGQAYQYVHHCHILEHEDNEMMRPFNVIG